MGLPQGRTNNPNGRPAGSKDKLPTMTKSSMINFLNSNIKLYFERLNALEGREYVRCFTELLKLVIPRPLNEEESNDLNYRSEFIRRMFNQN